MATMLEILSEYTVRQHPFSHECRLLRHRDQNGDLVQTWNRLLSQQRIFDKFLNDKVRQSGSRKLQLCTNLPNATYIESQVCVEVAEQLVDTRRNLGHSANSRYRQCSCSSLCSND
jgi:hypothetical protein